MSLSNVSQKYVFFYFYDEQRDAQRKNRTIEKVILIYPWTSEVSCE